MPGSRKGVGGPKTRAGKEIAKWNALKHGVCSPQIVLPGDPHETREQFQAFLEALWQDQKPEGVMEELLLEQIALCAWRLARCLRAEAGEVQQRRAAARLELAWHRWQAFQDALAFTDPRQARQTLWTTVLGLSHLQAVCRWALNQEQLSETARRYLKDRLGLDPDRLKEELGRIETWLEAAKEKEEAEDRNLDQVHGVPSAVLQDYETRLSRRLYRALQELHRVQDRKKGNRETN